MKQRNTKSKWWHTIGKDVQGWEIINKTKLQNGHYLFYLASPEYTSENGIFREVIKVRDNDITWLLNYKSKIKNIREAKINRWYNKKDDSFDLVCVRSFI